MKALLRLSAASVLLVLAGCGGEEPTPQEPEAQAQEDTGGAEGEDATGEDPTATDDEPVEADPDGLKGYPGIGGYELMVTDSHIWWTDMDSYLRAMPLEDLDPVEVEPGEQLGVEDPAGSVRTEVPDEWVYPVSRASDEDSVWILRPDDDLLGRFEVSDLMSGSTTEPATEIDLDIDVNDQLLLVDDMLWVVGASEAENAYQVIGLDPEALTEETRVTLPALGEGEVLGTVFPDLILGPSMVLALGERSISVITSDGADSAVQATSAELNELEETPIQHTTGFFLSDGRLVLAGSEAGTMDLEYVVTILDPATLQVHGQMPALDQNEHEVELIYTQPVPAFDAGVDLSLTRDSLQTVSFPDEVTSTARVQSEVLVAEGDVPQGMAGPLFGVPMVKDGTAWWGDLSAAVSVDLSP